MSKAKGSSGGPVAIRGFLVQTLVALLDIAHIDPPFIEITLEPAVGDEQFDFLWTDAGGRNAKQIKSTNNTFRKSDVEKWAAKLEEARSDEHCTLVLVGNVHPDLVGTTSHGSVTIEQKNLNLKDLLEQAAHRLAVFLEQEGQPSGTAAEREMIVHALVSKLEYLSTTSEPLSRTAFVELLSEWIRHAPTGELKVDISRIDKYAPERLIGRETEIALLDDSWQKVVAHEKGRPHVLGFVALGGEGKTSLVAKWLAGLAGKDWPGCESVFAWSFYSQGSREQVAVSSDLFLAEALRFFGDPEMAGSAVGAYEKGQRLAELVRGQRSLLILDGVEPLQYPPSSPTGSRLKDQGVEALLKGLAASSHGLCIVTTRFSILDLAAFAGTTWQEEELKRLSRAAGVDLLKDCGVKGSELRPDPTRENPDPLNEYEQLVEDVKGHALTLQLLGSYLQDAHDGDIRCRDRIKLEEADAEEQGGHAFRVLDAYVSSFERGTANDTPQQREAAKRALAILQLLGLFDRPATADCLEALWTGDVIPDLTEPLIGISDEQRRVALKRLEAGRLITINRETSSNRLASVDSHPLIREYFGERLKYDGLPRPSKQTVLTSTALEGHRTSEVWRAAHRRLYEHLCETTNEGDQPTLEELLPLYQAVAHGCHAGLQEAVLNDVYSSRITRGDAQYSFATLGAFGADLGAISYFFERPWSQVSSKLAIADQGWSLNHVSYILRALGRSIEALQPIQAALENAVTRENWRQAAQGASNLSELELTLGDVSGAISSAEESVIYADRCGNADWKMVSRCKIANALFQSGRLSEAIELFNEAEDIKAARHYAYPLLSSIPGFRHCDILVVTAERAAWREFAKLQRTSADRGLWDRLVGRLLLALSRDPFKSERHRCSYVAFHATETLEHFVNPSLLTAGLDHLTIGRAALYEAVLGEMCDRRPSIRIRKRKRLRKSDIVGPGAFFRIWDVERGDVNHEELAAKEIELAVSLLRSAGQLDYLPLGLLTRAWQRSLLGRKIGPDSAQSDLDEAWEIASRGPMPLFLADIHLHRARLFGRPVGDKGTGGQGEGVTDDAASPSHSGTLSPPHEYPWESVEHDLAEARRLIEKHGYGRRLGELEDAERALPPPG